MHEALKSWEFELVFREISCRTEPSFKKMNIKGELVRLLLLQNIINDKNENIFKNRVGYTVGRRMGKAHVRNRGRRILREAYREIAPLLPDNLVLILSLSHKGLKAKSHEILRELKFLFKKHGIIKCA